MAFSHRLDLHHLVGLYPPFSRVQTSLSLLLMVPVSGIVGANS